MSNQLKDLSPALVWQHFEDICRIPHGSGNEAALACHIQAFAKRLGLFCRRDEVNNVFIRLPASAGCEHLPAVMLQGHTDMVCEKDSQSTHNFLADGLSLFVDGDKVGAHGTTLGGDDGIAVAMMLAILQDPPTPHPAIECLFTVSEETGLEGAQNFDPVAMSATAKTMINIDSESENTVTAGCAGGMRTDITLPLASTDFDGIEVLVELDNFSGGHSGVEIHEGHTNAIKALADMVSYAMDKCPVRVMLSDLWGGGKDNAIPRDAGARLALLTHDTVVAEDFCRHIKEGAERLRATPNIISRDRDFSCSATVESFPEARYMIDRDAKEIFGFIRLVKDGVLAMSAHVDGLVAYSRNLGVVNTQKDQIGRPTALQFILSTRSACDTHLDFGMAELDLLAHTCFDTLPPYGVRHYARYPGWDYAPLSPIRDLWLSTAKDMYGQTPRVEAIHAGLECGILSAKMQGLDIISVGPDMWDIHTPRERLGISSTARLYALLREVLQNYCKG